MFIRSNHAYTFEPIDRVAGVLFLATGALTLSLGCASNKEKSCCTMDDMPAGVHITQGSNTVRVEINGQLFTEYYYKDVPRPYFYPVIGPEASPMTRNWPMASPEGEEHDHPHHRSLWFGHGAVNGVDFWAETNGVGKIVQDGPAEIKSGKRRWRHQDERQMV